MRLAIFNTQKAAMMYAHKFLMQNRTVGIKKLPSGRWEVRILAKRGSE